jgi:hypothetical protein
MRINRLFLMSMLVFWIFTLYEFVGRYERFGGTYTSIFRAEVDGLCVVLSPHRGSLYEIFDSHFGKNVDVGLGGCNARRTTNVSEEHNASIFRAFREYKKINFLNFSRCY